MCVLRFTTTKLSFDVPFGRCVVAEMFSDGRQLFDLSELLEYKRQQNKPQLKWVKDEDVKVSCLAGTCMVTTCPIATCLVTTYPVISPV